MHQSVFNQLTYNHAGTVIAQAACVDVAGLEVMTQCEHGQQWGVTSLVAKVVTELSASKLWTAIGLGCDELCVSLATQVVAHEWE
jgi:hypothetical protein